MTGGPDSGAPHRDRGRAALALATGVVLLSLFGIAACRARTAPDVGGPTVSALQSAPAPTTTGPGVPVSDGRPPAAGVPDSPSSLRIPALGITATVTAVGVNAATGELDVPPSVDRVGWYRYGPGMTADAGSIVIAGHVDSAEQGPGAFFRLGKLRPGDSVTLTGPRGGTRTFEVVARERYAKTAVPLDRYFARDGRPRLTLITCGGPFDRRIGHYRDNVVVTATPG
ncbi:class F sortase [Actinoplanes sp. NPDC049548]|uniref:class F sortase n=1 Tax=Actinoplanes sp. NPDC049548 TaxID=3155152 RepID=UPI00341989A3